MVFCRHFQQLHGVSGRIQRIELICMKTLISPIMKLHRVERSMESSSISSRVFVEYGFTTSNLWLILSFFNQITNAIDI